MKRKALFCHRCEGVTAIVCQLQVFWEGFIDIFFKDENMKPERSKGRNFCKILR